MRKKKVFAVSVATFALCVLLALSAILAVIMTGCTPSSRRFVREWQYAVQKADDETNYRTRKEVEDTCRAMIASYTADKLTYEQYKDNDNSEKQSWAEQAKMRANKTASTYNEYITKNSFVFADNIPHDIFKTLEYVE